MPIDPTLGTILASILGFAGGAMEDDPTQKRRSFTESPLTDPRQLLSESVLNTRNMGYALAEKAKKPIQLKSRAVSSVGRPSSIDPVNFATEGLNLGPLFGQVGAGQGGNSGAGGGPQDPGRAVDENGQPVRRRPQQRESRRDMI